MEENKVYYAFISYKREDEKWAKWLQDKLEHYRFPTNLNGRTDLPKNIRPTFRDVTDLNPGLLAEEIDNALRNSEWLIVVCSPRSAKSPWVCKEAQTFINLGRTDYIIPFVIEGNPFSNDPTTECYPEALLNLTDSKELLAANINEMGRDAAAIKVVARMFNLRFDALWQRYERVQKRRRRVWAGLIGLIAIFAFCIAGYIWNQNTKLHEKDWKMMENQAKAVAEKAKSLINDGDSYTARLLLANMLPDDIHNPKEKPFVSEVEDAMYKALLKDNAVLRGHNDAVITACFSPDSLFIYSISSDCTIGKWDAQTGELLENKPIGLKNVLFASFSKDGQFVVVSNSISIEIIFLKTGENFTKHLNISSFSRCPILSNDKKRVFIPCEDGKIRRFNLEKGMYESPYIGHSGCVFCVNLSSDGERLVSVSEDKTIRIWDVKSGKQIGKTLIGHTDNVLCASFSSDGKLIVSSSKDRTIRVWNSITGEQIGKTLTGHSDIVGYVAFCPDSKSIVSASNDKTIRLWDYKNGRLIGEPLYGHSGFVNYVTFSKDGGKILSTSDDMTMRLWDIRPKINMKLWERKFNHLISSITFDKKGQILALSSSDSIFILDVQTGKEKMKPLIGHLEMVNSVRFSPDNKYLVSSSDDNNVFIWDLHTRRKKVLWGHVNNVNYANFSNDGNFIVTASDDCTARIWNAKTGQQEIDPIVHKASVLYASFSPDGSKLATASKDNTARIWDVKKRKLLFALHHQGVVNSVSFSPDGKYIVTASSDKTIRIWDSNSGKQNGITIIGNTGPVCMAYFTTDGRKIISSSTESGCSIRIWDAMSRKQIGQQYADSSSYIIWSSVDNNTIERIIAGSFGNMIIMWKNPYSYDDIQAIRMRYLKRQLTDYERNEYFMK